MSDTPPPALERRVRHFIYTFFVAESRPPTVTETAVALRLDRAAAAALFQRLHDDHFLFLDPSTTRIRMANPLSAIPTGFRVDADGRRYWANCAWDMLGIPAMLHADAIVDARYADGRRAALAVRHGRLIAPPGLVHFPLPVRRWYDDLILT